jgi:hypothetical protein
MPNHMPPLLNIAEYVSGEEDQVAQHHENKTSLQWWNCNMKPMNKAGKNSQCERYHQRHLLRWCEWPVKHAFLPGADEVNAGADYESPDGGLMTLASRLNSECHAATHWLRSELKLWRPARFAREEISREIVGGAFPDRLLCGYRSGICRGRSPSTFDASGLRSSIGMVME